LFPTGFGSDSEKINSTKDIIKQSSSPNVDSTLFKEEPNLHIKQNFTDAIYPSTDTNSELSKQKS
jgi:hypothetical protein